MLDEEELPEGADTNPLGGYYVPSEVPFSVITHIRFTAPGKGAVSKISEKFGIIRKRMWNLGEPSNGRIKSGRRRMMIRAR